MKFARRSFVSTIFALGAALTVARPSLAQTAGKDYTPISPAQPTDDAAKVEVLEFFSYGCPHCADFNPLVTAWAAKLPADVVFKKVPITFGRGAWESIARLYYTLEITGGALGRILRHARDVMADALAVGGTSFDALYVNVNGASGYFDRSLAAYGQAGMPCRRCGAPIRREQCLDLSLIPT